MITAQTPKKKSITQSAGPEWPASSIFRIGSSFHRIGVESIATMKPTTNPPTIEIARYARCRFQVTMRLYAELRELPHQQQIQNAEPEGPHHRERDDVALIRSERFHAAQVLGLEREKDQDGRERPEERRAGVEAV